MWDTGAVVMPDGRSLEMLIQSNLFHGKLRQLPLTKMQTLQFGLSPSERWHLCNLTVSGGGISCQPVDGRYKTQKKFLPTSPGMCSLWVYQEDHSVFALCAGPPHAAQVLVMTADSAEDAEQWVRAIAGRLYLNELGLDDDMIPEFISIFYLFDTDGSGGISLDELQAASRGLGNPKSAEDLVATITNLQIELDSSGAINLPQFLKVLKDGLLAAPVSGEIMLLQAFRLLDSEGVGSISLDQLRGYLTQKGLNRMTEQEVDSFVTGADANGDGRIQYEEFVAANKARLHLDEGGAPGPVKPGRTQTVTQEANQSALDRARDSAQLKV
jgi:calmodulin